MNKTLAMMMGAAIAAGLIGCATQATRVASLRGADTASADLAPAQSLAYAGKRPGSGAPIERSFREQPPLIPHAIDNFDEITGGVPTNRLFTSGRASTCGTWQLLHW